MVGWTIPVVSLPLQWVHLAGRVNIVAHRAQLSWTVGTIPPAACIVPPDSMKTNQQGGSLQLSPTSFLHVLQQKMGLRAGGLPVSIYMLQQQSE